jgi:hypothetical protein
VIGMTVSIGRSPTRFSCGDHGAKSTKVGQRRFFTCPSFTGRHTQGLVIEAALQIDSMYQCSRPKTWMEASTVEQAAYHSTEGAIGPFDFVILGCGI